MATERPLAEKGFTLLEVMIALAILGLALTSILAGQAFLYSTNIRARNMTVADNAARCKMEEVEEYLLQKGYPEADQHDEGACCSDDSPKGMTCKWTIERVNLPDPQPPSLSGEGGVSSGGSDGGSSSGLGGLGALASLASNPSGLGEAGVGGVSQMLSQGTGPNGQSGVNGIVGMAMGLVYPQLKPLLEASIRRVTVQVMWNEGTNAREVKLVQFVTSPQKGLPPFDPNALTDAGPLPPGAATGMTTGTLGAAGGVGVPPPSILGR